MINSFLDRADAAGIFAADNIGQPVGKGQFLFLDNLTIMYKADSDMMVNISQQVQVQTDFTLNLDHIFPPITAAAGVSDQDDGAFKCIQMQQIVDFHAIANLDMVDDDAIFDAVDVACGFHRVAPFHHSASPRRVIISAIRT